MSLDKVKARSHVEGARIAYRIGVRSDYIQLLANDLEEALNLIDQTSLELSRSQNDTSRLQRDLDNEKTEYRKLREQSGGIEAAVAVLREIAASPKGAQKKAVEQLKAMGLAEAAPQADVVPPAKIEV